VILVVSDTSAISALLHVGRADILEILYDQVYIPPAVQQELLRAHRDLPSFIHVHAVAVTPGLHRRRTILDEGEACAITLAEQIHADLLLIDEKKGREEAEQSGLTYIGLVGALIEAKQRGVIPLLRPLLGQFVTEAGFRLAPALQVAVLHAVNETIS